MTDTLEDALRAALRNQADELDGDGVTRVLAFDYAAAVSERCSARERLSASRSRIGGQLVPAVGAFGLALIAAVIVAVLTLGNGTAPALAGWTSAPTAAAHAGQTAAALRGCGLPQPLIVDTRGPYTVVVFIRRRQLNFCIQSSGLRGGGSGPIDQRTPAPDAIDLGPGTGLDVSGYPPVTLMYARAGSGVSGVTFAMSSGSPITATVTNGWYLAWWPGPRHATSVSVTTAAGTKTQPLDGTVSGCPGPERICPKSTPSVRVAPDIGTYRLFRQPSAPIPAALRANASGVERVLDNGARDGVEAVADLLGIQGSGTEVCVLVRPTHAPAGSITDQLSGACAGPSSSVTQTPYVIIGGAVGRPPYHYTVAAGLVPDGIEQITLLFTQHRKLTVPVSHNAIATHIHWPLIGIRWSDATGIHTVKDG